MPGLGPHQTLEGFSRWTYPLVVKDGLLMAEKSPQSWMIYDDFPFKPPILNIDGDFP
jgi:hypothetical protein